MPLSEPAAVSPDGQRVVVVVRRGRVAASGHHVGGRHERANAGALDRHTRRSRVRPLPTGRPMDRGSWQAASTPMGPALFKIPANGGDPVRIVTGQAVNPVWSPDGSLIVYGGPVVAGQTALAWVRPDGTPVDLPAVRVRPGGYRFLPDGKGLVFQPTGPAPDFWLLDLATKTTRQLTHLSDRGRIQTFDIMPDGKAIVFDRIRQNSDIVLIDLPK